MTKENSKGMKDASAQTYITFQGSPYSAYRLLLHTQVTLSKSRSEAITVPMICSVIQHGLLPIFSIVERIIMLDSNAFLNDKKGQSI